VRITRESQKIQAKWTDQCGPVCWLYSARSMRIDSNVLGLHTLLQSCQLHGAVSGPRWELRPRPIISSRSALAMPPICCALPRKIPMGIQHAGHYRGLFYILSP